MSSSYPRVKKDCNLPGSAIRASRHLLGWSRETLAEKTGLTPATITRIETGHTPSQASHEAIQKILEKNGIEIVVDKTNQTTKITHKKRTSDHSDEAK